MQCSLNKDLQHLKWQPQKSWTFFQGFLDAQDKQLTQYLLILRSKWNMLQNYSKNPKSECPNIWIRLPKHKWPKSRPSVEEPVVLLGKNLYGHPLAGLLWERQIWESSIGTGWEKVFNWERLFVNRARRLCLSVYVDDIKLAGKTENVEPTWKILMKDVDLGEPTSFLDHVHWGCTRRECQISKDIVANYSDMFESTISAGAKEKLPTRVSGKLDAETISSWSHDMEGHAKKWVKRYCEFAN